MKFVTSNLRISSFLIIFSCVLATILAAEKKTGVVDTATCNNDCKGLHDVGCQTLKDGQAACRCQAGYYSVQKQCEHECEDNQFWSLFTYGECADVTPSKEFSKDIGLCSKMCVFRVRLWATIFIIILFASAILLLLLMLPGCITSWYTCIFLRKQKKRAEEDAAMAAGVMDPQGSIMKPGAANPAMMGHPAYNNYPFYGGWPYYGQAR